MKENLIKIQMAEGSIMLIPMVAAFKKRYPHIEVILSEVHQVDILIRSLPFADENKYISTPLFTERILIALPKTSPLAKKDSVSIEDIRNQPVIGLLRGFKFYRQLAAYFELHEYTPNIVASSSNSTTIAEFVRNGFGISFFPEHSWSGVAGEDIVSRPFAEFECHRAIYASYKKDTPMNDAAKKFLEFSVEYFKNK